MYFTFRKLRKRYLKMVKRYESQSRITTRNWLFSFTIRLHWAERTFYWHFVLSLRNLRLEILKSFDLDFTGQKLLVFCFSFFHFDDFLTTFVKDLMKKTTIFITNIKSPNSSYIFTKIWHLEIFDNETTACYKKLKNYAFWRLIFADVERKKKLILRIYQI